MAQEKTDSKLANQFAAYTNWRKALVDTISDYRSWLNEQELNDGQVDQRAKPIKHGGETDRVPDSPGSKVGFVCAAHSNHGQDQQEAGWRRGEAGQPIGHACAELALRLPGQEDQKEDAQGHDAPGDRIAAGHVAH